MEVYPLIRNILNKSIQIYSIVYLLFTLVVASSIDISPSYNYSNYGGVVPISSPFYKTAAASDSFDPGSISRKFQYAKIASTNPMYDDFEGATYSLKDGEKSPNGKWLDKYNGYGSIGVRTESDG